MLKRAAILLFLVLHLSALAQEYARQFVQITTEHGLSQSHVRTIYQDTRGYMWLGTEDGLNRYDGHSFKIYRADLKHPGLPHSAINKIARKSEHQLWICTAMGVAIYDSHSDSLEHFTQLPDIPFSSVTEDYDKTVWFGSSEGLFHYYPKQDSLVHYNAQKRVGGLSNNQVNEVYLDTRQNLWIATEGGLNLYDRRQDNFTKYLADGRAHSLSGSAVRTLTEDYYGRMWVGMAQGGLDLFVNYQERPTRGVFKNIQKGQVNTLLADKKNNLWIGCGGTGRLYLLNLATYKQGQVPDVKAFYHTMQDQTSISDNSISSFFEDVNGDIWVGTFSGGVSFHSHRLKQFHNYRVNLSQNRTLSWHLVNCFVDDGPWLWIGTDAGLDRLDKSSGEIKNYLPNEKQPFALAQGGVHSLLKDSRGHLWIGSRNGDLQKYLPEKDGFRTFTAGPQSEDSGPLKINALSEDSQGQLWLGTLNNGLYRFQYEAGSFSMSKMHRPGDAAMSGTTINHILEIAENELLLCTPDGLEIFNTDKQVFTRFIHHPDQAQSLGKGACLSAYKDSGDNLWIATATGLNLFRPREGTFDIIDTHNGLPNAHIQGILEDEEGHLWISTNAGLVKYIDAVKAPLSYNFRLYDSSDGLIANDFSVRAAHKGSDGYLNFGSSRGFTRFHPKLIFENEIPPATILTDFRLIGRDTKSELPILSKKDINSLQELRLRYHQNNFELHFAAINYLNPVKNRYRFKLEGYETQWREAGHLAQATYTNIGPGSYTFIVMGSNNDGVWSREARRLQITIVPPWWRTYTFLIALAFSIILLTFWLIRQRFALIQEQNRNLEIRIARRTHELSEANQRLQASQKEITLQNHELEQHRNRLEELVKERTAELEKAKEKAEHSDRLKSAFMANMSHEIRTPMNAIVGFSNLLEQEDLESDERKEFVKIISSNSEALLILINDILDISIIETNQMKLVPKWFSLNELLFELERYFTMRGNEHVQIKALPDDKGDLQLFNDPTRLRQVITNLVNNATKFTSTGHIHFGYRCDNQSLLFYVEDTGIGIATEEQGRIFNAFYKVEDQKDVLYRGTGLGLSLSKRLLEQMGGKIWVQSEPGKGSTFFFTIPLLVDNQGPSVSVKKD